MKIQGTITHILPLQSGVSKAGKDWKKQDFVLQTNEQYPKSVCFNLFNDKIEANPIQMGGQYEVDVDINSREYNGKWYTEVSAFRVTPLSNVPVTPQVQQMATQAVNTGSDDLPF